jgi:hydroxyacylglutathione hydrolase
MVNINIFTFNPFGENTYVLWDETKEGIIIDPGCYTGAEKRILKEFIDNNEIKPIFLVNTHSHIDHVLGNAFVNEQWNLLPIIHKNEAEALLAVPQYGQLYGINAEPSPVPVEFLGEGQQIKFGNTILDVIFTPGHSPGHVTLVCEPQKFIISGDVLFHGSIGRTDLPGGDYRTLIDSIIHKLMVLEDDYKVYPGHGEPTTIGFERKNNPFLKEEFN